MADRRTGRPDVARYREEANDSLASAYEEPKSLEEYVDAVFETPSIAAHASEYLLAAIESSGTRTVVEEGEEIDRYRFFDDPYNDGEHAIQGHTEVLNDLVDDLRSIATGRGKDEKIIWIAGPTATGKSELKRCLINGLRGYSKTDEGRRYTIEWNVATLDDVGGLSYGDPPGAPPDRESDWYRSPVQANPLLVYPPDVREQLVADLNVANDDHVDLRVDGELDPFSREAYESLAGHYKRTSGDALFSKITDGKHLRVTNYVVDVGSGIGVLHSEDAGSPKQRLVGSWMQTLFRELDSRGRKNPQAFSYDGILAQGNGVMTIIEDASQHADLLQKLLSVPDEATIKLDTGIELTLDTQLFIISNPDLENQLDQHAEAGGADPLKALKRRLDKREFRYLTTLSLEAELLRRELTNETEVWTADNYADIEARLREPVSITVRDADDGVIDRELAPHTIEAAAMYAVLTRLDDADLPADLGIVDKALIYDRGYHFEDDERIDADEFEIGSDADGSFGMPVTYTRDVIAELVQRARDRRDPDLPVEHVIMPEDVLDSLASRLSETPLFSPGERERFEHRVVDVKNYIHDKQEADVLDAILYDQRIDEDVLERYVEHVYAWGTDEALYDDHGELIEPDSLRMKLVEVEHLGRFTDADYDETDPSEAVRRFRREYVITALNRYAWEQRDADFGVSDVSVAEIPALAKLIDQSDWSAVARQYEDLDPKQWRDPPSGTETAAVKEEAIDVMVEHQGYSRSSAELTSRQIMSEVSHDWTGNTE